MTSNGACCIPKGWITMLCPLSWDDDNWQSMFHTWGIYNHALTVVMRRWQPTEHVSYLRACYQSLGYETCSASCLSADSLMTLEHNYTFTPIYLLSFFLLWAFGHVCRLALYDIRLSHIVKKTSALFVIFIKEIASKRIHLQLCRLIWV